MKINPDTMLKLIEAVKTLESLPFSVDVSTITKPEVLLFEYQDFMDTFPDCEIREDENNIYREAVRDGVKFKNLVIKNPDDDLYELADKMEEIPCD